MMRFLLTIISSMAFAEATVQPCDYSKKLFQAISSSATYSEWNRSEDICTITWTPNPLKPITFFDMKANMDSLRAEFKEIKRKINSNTASNQDVKRAILIISEIQGIDQ